VPAADRVLLDTNVALYLARGHRLAQQYRRHVEGRVVALSFATAAELMLTSRRAADPEAALAYWREKLPYYVVLFPDLGTCELWARLAADCYARGRPRQDADLWIAATALRWGLPLVTHNVKDFSDIAALTLVSEAPRRAD
jgi:tRNA(fMet)-specific endonuclease VapC